MDGHECLTLVDTGASLCLINPKFVEDHLRNIELYQHKITLNSVTGEHIYIDGCIKTWIKMKHKYFKLTACVMKTHWNLPIDLILGIDFIKLNHINIIGKTGELYYGSEILTIPVACMCNSDESH